MFGSYIKSRRKTLGTFVLFAGIMAVVFALYRLPVAAVGYGALICCFFGGIILAADYRGFCRRHRLLSHITGGSFAFSGDTKFTTDIKASQDVAAALEYLPEPENLPEEDYQRIIRTLEEQRRQEWQRDEERYQELVDYYTTWVHQIKTPIAAMHLILQDGETEDGQELGAELLRVEQYVEMVLCYLRLNADSTDYVIKEYDLDALLRQAVRKNAPFFIKKKIRLEYEPVKSRVVTDEKWLLFVIEQILSNALKYTGTGGTVSITLEAPKTLCIQDTGIGIAPEDLPRIFEKGYTGLNGRSDKKATGLGMYLCRRICDNLGHRIWVTSAPGEGTRVCIDVKNAGLEVE